MSNEPRGLVHLTIGTEIGETSVIREIRNAEVVEFYVDEQTGHYVLRARRPEHTFLNDPLPKKFRDTQTQVVNLTSADLVALQREAEQYAQQAAEERKHGNTIQL